MQGRWASACLRRPMGADPATYGDSFFKTDDGPIPGCADQGEAGPQFL